ERMLIQHRAVEKPLGFGRARGLEMYFPELLIAGLAQDRLSQGHARRCGGGEGDCERDSHAGLPIQQPLFAVAPGWTLLRCAVARWQNAKACTGMPSRTLAF